MGWDNLRVLILIAISPVARSLVRNTLPIDKYLGLFILTNLTDVSPSGTTPQARDFES